MNAHANQMDMRCMCSKCILRTQETYTLGVTCSNCGWVGTALIRKGDKPLNAQPCPACGVSWCTYFAPDAAQRPTALLACAARLLLEAVEMHLHNIDIFKGRWVKGSKAWNGEFVDRSLREGAAKLKAALQGATEGAGAKGDEQSARE